MRENNYFFCNNIISNNKKTRFLFVQVLLWTGFFLFANLTQAATYYISNSGSDTNSGTSAAAPWQTLAKVNATTFQPGDNILFKKGDTFYGTLDIRGSGTANNPIVYSAYDSGSNPVITGFTTITGWSDEGGGIYSYSLSASSKTNMVIIDGVEYAMGRYPNLGTYLKYESANANTTITDNELPDSPNWSGAEAVIEKNAWTIDRNLITSQASGVITYTTLGTTWNATANNKYFIQNDIRTLDTYGEWYHDVAAGKFYMYFGAANPDDHIVKVATLNNLVYDASGEDYVTLENLAFTGSIKEAFKIHWQNDNIVIQNNDLSFIGTDGILLGGNADVIRNNNISHTNGTGIYSDATNIEIDNNRITDIGMIEGMSGLGPVSKRGIFVYYNNVSITNNSLEQIGTFGICLSSGVKTGVIQNNFLSGACKTATDCGAIYMGYDHTSMLIDGNIVLASGGNGIYLDEYANGVTVTNNTSANNASAGLKFHKAHNNNVQNNILFNNGVGIDMENWVSSEDNLHDDNLSGNIAVAKTLSQYALTYSTRYPNQYTPGTLSGNYYTRPINEANTFRTNIPGSDTYRTLSGWQALTGQDLDSQVSPVVLTDYNDIFFDYALGSSKTINLSVPMIDIAGTKHAGSYNIPAYRSVILLPDPNPILPDTTKPVISSFTMPATATTLLVPGIAISATDNTAVTGYRLSETNVAPLASDSGWSSSAPTSYTFSSAGAHTLHAWAKDAAGNISSSGSASITISISSGGGGGGSSSGGSSSGGTSSSSSSNSTGATTTVVTINAATASSTATTTNISNDNNKSSDTGQSVNNDSANSSRESAIEAAANQLVSTEKNLVARVNKTLSSNLAGRLLLQVESHGEAWYLNPANKLKYYLGTPAMAFSIMRSLGQGISNANLAKIKIANANLDTNLDTDGDGLSDSFEDAIGSDKTKADTDGDGYSDKTELINDYNLNGANKLSFDSTFTNNQQGKIFLQVESHGEAWYVNPLTKLRYYLGRPDDAYSLMRSLSLGISNENLRQIEVGETK